jgi:hypothetical protein
MLKQTPTEAQNHYDTLNDEVYQMFARLGLSDEAMLAVLRISPSVRQGSERTQQGAATAAAPASPSATAKLTRTGDTLICELSFTNPTVADVTFKRNVAGKADDRIVKPGHVSYSNISIPKTAQKSGTVKVVVVYLDGGKTVEVLSKSFNLLEI